MIPGLLQQRSIMANQPLQHTSTYETCYRKAVQSSIHFDPYAHIPCSICPVAADCGPHSTINPITCPYLTEWLA